MCVSPMAVVHDKSVFWDPSQIIQAQSTELERLVDAVNWQAVARLQSIGTESVQTPLTKQPARCRTPN
jgi:hypothetical protein